MFENEKTYYVVKGPNGKYLNRLFYERERDAVISLINLYGDATMSDADKSREDLERRGYFIVGVKVVSSEMEREFNKFLYDLWSNLHPCPPNMPLHHCDCEEKVKIAKQKLEDFSEKLKRKGRVSQ